MGMGLVGVSGVYIYLKELEKFKPEIVSACRKSLQTEYKDLDFIRLNNKEFHK